MSPSGLYSARREARRQIAELLRHGLLTFSEIIDRIEMSFDEDLGNDVVRSLVADEWQRVSQATVPRPTPLERLQAAFDSLDELGIMGRHYPMGDRSDAESWIFREIGLAKQQGKLYWGYCFYDEHLVEMMSRGSLAFCFGSAMRQAPYAHFWGAQGRVGTAVVEALKAAGFEVEWTGRVADVIRIDDVVWSGPRDPAGTPLISSGIRLEGEPPPRMRNENEREPVSVFVSCANGQSDAHRLIAAIASRTGNEMYGGPETFESLPAAVAHTTSTGSVLDFIAAESTPGARGLIASRDLSNACSFLVAVTPSITELDTEWWERFHPDMRLLVLTKGGSLSTHEGSRVLHVELSKGTGLEQLLDVVAASTAK